MSTKSHKWAANIGIIFGSTKLFLTLLLKFFPQSQSLDSLDAYYGQAAILRQLSQSKEPEPQCSLQSSAYRQKHLGKRQYIEKDTEP